MARLFPAILLLLPACAFLRAPADQSGEETTFSDGTNEGQGLGLPRRGWSLLLPPRQIDLLLGLPPSHVVGRPDGGAELVRGCESIGVDANGRLEGGRILGTCESVVDAVWSQGRLYALLAARGRLTLATAGAGGRVRVGSFNGRRSPGDLDARLLPITDGLAAVWQSPDGVEIRRIIGPRTGPGVTLPLASGVSFVDAAAWRDEIVVLAAEDLAGSVSFRIHRIGPDGMAGEVDLPPPFPASTAHVPYGWVRATREGYAVLTGLATSQQACDQPAFAESAHFFRLPHEEGRAEPLSFAPPDGTSLPAPGGVLDDGVLVQWKPCARGPLRLQVIATDGRTTPISDIRDTFSSDYLLDVAGDRVAVAWEVSTLTRVGYVARRTSRLPEMWVGARVAGHDTLVPPGAALADATVSDLDGDGVPEGVGVLMFDADAPALARLVRDGTGAWRVEILRSLGAYDPAARAEERPVFLRATTRVVSVLDAGAHAMTAFFQSGDAEVPWIVLVTTARENPLGVDLAVPPWRPEPGDSFRAPSLRISAGRETGEVALEVDPGRVSLALGCDQEGCRPRSRAELIEAASTLVREAVARDRATGLGLLATARALVARLGPSVQLRPDSIEGDIQQALLALP